MVIRSVLYALIMVILVFFKDICLATEFLPNVATQKVNKKHVEEEERERERERRKRE